MAKKSVLDKYSEMLSRAQDAFSFGRDLFNEWTSIKISVLASIMSKADFVYLLIEIGFLNTKFVKCKTCKGQMTLQEHSTPADGVRWICRNYIPSGSRLVKSKPCNGTRSIRSNSWFYQSKLKPVEILMFTYYWWYNIPMRVIRKEFKMSDRTIVDWSSFCREVAIDQVLDNPVKIGGPGVVVEIDESKFGKRKYHRGKRVEGQWVFGGVERNSSKCFLIPVEDRKAETLIPLIKEWILPGTIIISDCWASYNSISSHNDFQHLTVNHSIEFKNLETGAHTNTIEGLWYHAKLSCPSFNRKKDHFLGYLCTFILKKRWKEETDSFESFMKAAANLYADPDVITPPNPSEFHEEEEVVRNMI